MYSCAKVLKISTNSLSCAHVLIKMFYLCSTTAHTCGAYPYIRLREVNACPPAPRPPIVRCEASAVSPLRLGLDCKRVAYESICLQIISESIVQCCIYIYIYIYEYICAGAQSTSSCTSTSLKYQVFVQLTYARELCIAFARCVIHIYSSDIKKSSVSARICRSHV